jgi:hypothetical protein
LVIRSAVEPVSNYREYKEVLRKDFRFSCAYCSTSECEAQAVRMTIDHYEPRKARPDLEHAYSNLMYACDQCNSRKGDRCPPEDARATGYRFFRADEDRWGDHFRLNGRRLDPESNTGFYSVEALDLNRHGLQKLRELRERLYECERVVAEGLRGLQGFPIDLLPPPIRGRAAALMKKAGLSREQLADDIDAILEGLSRSEFLEPDSDAHAQDRSQKLNATEALFAGSWRAPREQPRRSRSSL